MTSRCPKLIKCSATSSTCYQGLQGHDLKVRGGSLANNLVTCKVIVSIAFCMFAAPLYSTNTNISSADWFDHGHALAQFPEMSFCEMYISSTSYSIEWLIFHHHEIHFLQEYSIYN